MVNNLKEQNITALTMDGIPRISRAQRMDALSSMSTVTGYKSVLVAANAMPKFIPMTGTAIGTVKPAQFLVIGSGVVGLQAIATAKRLGGVVKALDIRKEACTQAASLGAKIIDFDIPQELALGEGGYAQALDKKWLLKEQEAIGPLLEQIDVAILSALVPGEVAPILITEEMIKTMGYGSVIMDISIDQGGNCAITEPGQMIKKNGITICGIQNIPGRMAVHASWLYAHNLYYYVQNLYKDGPGKINFEDEIVANSLVTYQGSIKHKGTLKAMQKDH
jgi:NAD(P) transhydrogenase subunit alpha